MVIALRPLKWVWAEDGKLLSRLEWPYGKPVGRRKKVGRKINLHSFKITIFHVSGKKSSVILIQTKVGIRAAVIQCVCFGVQYYNHCYSLIWVDDLANLYSLTR